MSILSLLLVAVAEDSKAKNSDFYTMSDRISIYFFDILFFLPFLSSSEEVCFNRQKIFLLI